MKGAVIVTRLTIYRQRSDTEGGRVGEVPTVPHSKTNKETRLVERNIYFILDAGMGTGEGGYLSKGWLPQPLTISAQELLIDRGRELYVETTESALTVILKLVTSGLTRFILIVLSTVNLKFQGWFPFLKVTSQNCCSLCHDYSLVIM